MDYNQIRKIYDFDNKSLNGKYNHYDINTSFKKSPIKRIIENEAKLGNVALNEANLVKNYKFLALKRYNRLV